jgi:hypothetical protein
MITGDQCRTGAERLVRTAVIDTVGSSSFEIAGAMSTCAVGAARGVLPKVEPAATRVLCVVRARRYARDAALRRLAGEPASFLSCVSFPTRESHLTADDSAAAR